MSLESANSNEPPTETPTETPKEFPKSEREAYLRVANQMFNLGQAVTLFAQKINDLLEEPSCPKAVVEKQITDFVAIFSKFHVPQSSLFEHEMNDEYGMNEYEGDEFTLYS